MAQAKIFTEKKNITAMSCCFNLDGNLAKCRIKREMGVTRGKEFNSKR